MSNRAMAWLRSLFLRRRLEREMRDEMAQHIERATSRLRARGLSQADAERQAHREFGNMDYIREHARDARGSRWAESIVQDVRFAARQFVRTPLLTVTMIVVLSLGLSGSVALFTALHSVLTRPPAGVPSNEALVRIRGMQREFGTTVDRPGMPLAEVQAYAARTDVFDDVAIALEEDVIVDVGGASPDVFVGTAYYVTPNYLGVLGLRPALGADLPPVDDAAEAPVVVISDALWRTRFGGASDVVGRQLRVAGATFTIAGVAPAGFKGLGSFDDTESLWLPLSAEAVTRAASSAPAPAPDEPRYTAIGLLATGVSAADATARLRDVPRAHASPEHAHADVAMDVVPLRSLNDTVDDDLAVASTFMSLVCLLILMIVCTNVSGLQLGQALSRRREIAVRLSLGAARSRVVRQLVTESVLLACIAAALSVLLLRMLLIGFAHVLEDVPLVLHMPTVLFAFGFALLIGIGFGISPALHATRLSVGSALKDSGAAVSGPKSRLQNGLVIAQVALTQPLLVGLCAMLIGEVQAEIADEWNAPPEQLLSVSFALHARNATPARNDAELTRIAERIRLLPDVAGAVKHVYGSAGTMMSVHAADVGGRASTAPFQAIIDFAAPGMLDMVGIRLLHGRDFVERDSAQHAPGVIIGEQVARRLWGTTDVVGRRFTSDGFFPRPTDLTIIGVVAEDPAARNDDAVHMFFPPLYGTGSLLVRTRVPAASVMPSIQRIAAQVAPDLPVSMETRAQTLAASRESARRMTVMISVGGALALLLSAIGLYAIVSRSVAQRVREVGIRSALGATRLQVVRMFVMKGMGLGLAGLFLGLPLGLSGMLLLASELQVERSDTPLSGAIIGAIALAVTLVASWLPARRAARLDPLKALRAE